MLFARTRMESGRRTQSLSVVSCFILALALGWLTPMHAVAQNSEDEGRLSPIDELLALYEKAMEEITALKTEVGQLTLELKKATRERDELKLFIANHDAYGADFEKYAISEEEKRQAVAAAKAREARAKRDERKRRMQALREQRIAELDNRGSGAVNGKDDDPWAERAKVLVRAGYRRIGDFVFVGQMGYVYNSETETEYRYSPFLQGWYTDEHKDIDYTQLTLSGTIVHATDGLHDLSIAIAFYDENGGQIGQTTVRVDGARPGTPYPFTSEIQMAADIPFADYNAWVLYSDETPLAPVLVTDPPKNTGTDPGSGTGQGGSGGASGTDQKQDKSDDG